MYNNYVRCNYKRTLWFINKVLNKNMKLSTKTKNLIKTCTYHKKDFRKCKFFSKLHKLSCAKMLAK